MTDAGASFYAGMEYLHSKGVSKENGRDFSVRALSKAFISAVQTCDGAGAVVNLTDLPCGATINYSETVACKSCQEIQKTYPEIRKSIDGETLKPDHKFLSPNLCSPYCNSCAVEDVDQSVYVHLSTTCDFDDDFFVRMQSAVAVEVEEAIKKNAKAMKKIYSSEPNLPGIKTSFSSKIVNTFKGRFANDMRTVVNAFQALRIKRGSESVLISGVQQGITVDVTTTMISRVMASVDFYDSQELNASLSELNQNDSASTLIDAAKNTISSVTDLWDELEGKIMFIAIGVILVIIIGVVVRILWKKPS